MGDFVINNSKNHVINSSEKFFYGIKKLTDTFEGLGKLSGLLGPGLAIFSLYRGELVPSWAIKFDDDIKTLLTIKSGFGWINVGHDLHIKAWDGGVVAVAKRIMSIVLTFLFTCDYLERLVEGFKISSLFTVAQISLKMIILEILTIINLVEDCLAWHKKLNKHTSLSQKVITLNTSPSDLSKLNKRIEERTETLKSSLKDTILLKHEQRVDLRQQLLEINSKITSIDLKSFSDNFKAEKRKKHLLNKYEKISKKLATQMKLKQFHKIQSIDPKNDYLLLKKKSEMLNLVLNFDQEAKKDLRSLGLMNAKQYKKYKIKQLHVRQNNILFKIKKIQLGTAWDFVKLVSFSLGISKGFFGVKAITEAFCLEERLFSLGLEGIKFLSGCMAVGKFFLDEIKLQDKIRPSACVA